MEHPGVTCPTCESWKSPKKLYRDTDTAKTSLDRLHHTRCNECGAEFSYTPRYQESRRRILGIPYTGRTVKEVVITDLVIIKEGQL